MKSFMTENEFITRQDIAFGGLETNPANRAMQEEQSSQAGQEQATQPPQRPFSPQLVNATTAEVLPYNTGPYLPFWQTSPALPILILPSANMLTSTQLLSTGFQVLETNMASFSNAITPGDLTNLFLARGQYRQNQELFSGDALTALLYPVFDNFSASRKLAGMVLSDVSPCLVTHTQRRCNISKRLTATFLPPY
jgi:hypothetical protein